jgi:1-acyl-sn-glycerol-3-phosphate acyltransferase
MILLHKGSLLRQILHTVISLSRRLFFRRIETVNIEKVPKNEPIIFVFNHPNGFDV